jgi:hypothetical protein
LKDLAVILFCFFSVFIFQQKVSGQRSLHHYIFIARDKTKIHDSSFYLNRGIEGAQIIYPWRLLETEKGVYDFSEIEEDLSFLLSKGKKLFIQLQDVTFDSAVNAVPAYLLTDPQYHGGQDPQYEQVDGQVKHAGWMARRWDTTVENRYHQLLLALAKQFDGRIEGINLPETSTVFGDKKELEPAGFSESIYLQAIQTRMHVLKASFTQSTPILYANFMPGGVKPLAKLYQLAKEIGLGMGGPDIKVYRPFQMMNSYPLIRELSPHVRTGLAVQDGNFALMNPKTNKQVTFADVLDFASNYLQLHYIFWGTEEPYYTKEVLPYLRSLQ